MAIVYQISLHGSAYDARGKDWNTVEKRRAVLEIHSGVIQYLTGPC